MNTEIDLDQVGQRILDCRNSKRWTQAELAFEAGCTPTAIWQYECGLRAPSANTLLLLSKAFAVSVDWLLGAGDQPKFGEWQPIETAPRDGTRILGWCDGQCETLDFFPAGDTAWHVEGWGQVSDSGRWTEFEPTHWMALLDGPQQQKDKA